MQNKLLSVIVPIYNVEKYLNRAVDSVLNQTYQNLEIILVDDGGTDACPAICDKYALKDTRIKVIHKENGGLSDARNVGLEIATGAYIAYMDSDDFILPDTYEKLIESMERNQADMAVCNYETVNEEGAILPNYSAKKVIKDEMITGEEAIRRLCGPNYAYYVTAWNRIYKAEIAKAVLFPKGKIHEDEYTAHLYYAKTGKIACVEKAYYQYVIREDSIMTKKYGIKNLDYFEALERRIRYCMEVHIDDVVAPFTRWMLKDLSLAYGKLDFSDINVKEKYEECKDKYEELYREVRKTYPLGVKTDIATMIFRVSPKILNKIFV